MLGSEKQSAPTPTLSLPKGGGAIRDIGEKFSVNPVTGTGSLAVPIFTSPGRSGFSPRLSLSYDSGGGNGPFALGWQLSLPSVMRKTNKGLPRYGDAHDTDVFILSDAEDLMPVLTQQNNQWRPLQVPEATLNGEAYGIKRYRPRIEGLFARIERWQRKSDGDIHWRATTRDNVTSIYGQNPFCRIADPAVSSRVFKWLLEATFDDKGNVIFYEYKAEDSTGINRAAANERNRQNGNAPFTNRYIKRIRYGARTPYAPGEDLSKRTDWLFETVFDYGEHDPVNPAPTEDPARKWNTRADPFSSFRSTFDVRTCRLCQRVLMFHHFPDTPDGQPGYDGLVRSTDFTYDQEDPGSPLQGNRVATKLQAVTQTGYSPNTTNQTSQGYLAKSFPPLEFTYSEAEIDPVVRTVEPGSLENLPSGLNGPDYQWVDLDGEGMSGILTQQASGFFYKRNLSPLHTILENGTERTAARFGPVELIGTRPALAGAEGRPQFMSLAGDGHQDLVDFESPVRGFYKRSDFPGWENFSPFRSFPNLSTRDPNLKFLDVDGDGLTDMLISEDEVLSWHRSLGGAGFGPREYVRKPFDEERGPALIFADPTQSIFLADMCGDGLTDIVRIRNGEVCYWPNLGYGRFGAKVTMDGSPCFETPDLFDPRRIRLGDIDGSGTTDILYLAADNIAVYLNQSGNSLADRELLPGGFPATNSLTSVSILDLLGNGVACMVWSSPLTPDAGRQIRYVDLMGGQKPHLLTAVNNNMGAETRIRYVSSTKFYVEDRAAGTPWVTKLPFPVHVVEKMEVFDYIGKTRLASSYRYRHGYFDGWEREFRGFGYVEQRDAESFGESDSLFTQDTGTEIDALHVPPVVTKTWFHTGAWPNGETIIRMMAHEYFSATGEGPLLPDTILPTEIFLPDNTRLPYSLTGEEQREAIRSLKGGILRQEIYADDGSANAGIPYSVSERNYTVECLQPRASNLYAVFSTHARETINYHHERNPGDPRVTHNAVLKADVFGNVLQTISAAYGRNLASAGVSLAPSPTPGTPPDLTSDPTLYAQSEQLTSRLTLGGNAFTNGIDGPEAYRLPVPSETCVYELTQPPRPDDSAVYSFVELQNLANTAQEISYEAIPDLTKTQKRLVEKVRTLYLGDDLSGPLAPGQIGSLGLAYETYKLAFTSNLAQQVFVAGNSNPNRPADAASLDTLLSGKGGYVNSQGDSDWWIPSGRTFYSSVPQNPPDPFGQDVTFAAANFYLPQAYRDPFGQYTRLTYDSCNVLMAQTQDALGNTVVARNDYRVLQPAGIIDPNGSRSEAAFDVFGMVVGTAVQGKVTAAGASESGDSLAGFTADLLPQDIDSFINSANPLLLAPGLLGNATTRIIYDLDRFMATKTANPADPGQWQPNFAATLARETHVNDPPPAGQPLKIQVGFSYSDGLGREIQKKIQAEPGPVTAGGPDIDPRWVGSGWTILNNKGKPVRQHEPFFSATHDFEFANIVGVTSTLFYDPLERVIATLHPDHTWEKVVFDPWKQISWDANDTVQSDPKTDPDVGDLFNLLPDADYLPTWYQLRTDPAQSAAAFPDPEALSAEQDAAGKAAAHQDTPACVLFDVMGRPFLSVTHNRYPENGGIVDEFYTSRTELDIEGNQLSVSDALGRAVMTYEYDMLKNRIHQASMEAGDRWMLGNVAGKPIRGWDSRGFLRAVDYDELQRPTGLTVSGNGLSGILAEKTIYGDSIVGGPSNPEQTNHRGKVYQTYDAAGLVTSLGYDFKGNLLRGSRQLLAGAGYKTTADWNQNPALGETFTSSTRYDALNRVVQQIAPRSDSAGTKVNLVQPGYNEANLLETVDTWLQQAAEPPGLLDPESASFSTITNIDYDAKGQRQSIEYGNGASTSYTYDAQTFRLVRLLTTRPSDGVSLQDLRYFYDPVGNITHIQDDAQQTVYFSNKRVEPSTDYVYDAIYRLIKATGREHLGQAGGAPNAPSPPSYNDAPNVGLPHPNDGNAMGIYIENFAYDPAGNFQQIQHIGSDPANPGWTRVYAYAEPSLIEPARVNNRLTGTTVGGTTETYSNAGNGYDPHGNMLRLPQLQVMQWDFNDHLQMTRRQAINNDDQDGTLHQGERTYYVYDASGQRVLKATEASLGGLVRQRVYLGGFEIYREYDNGGSVSLERQTLHLMDGKKRVALVEMRTQGDDGTPAQLIRCQFGNHLGSACLELDDHAQIISYEEYYPYGSTSYQAVDASIKAAAKRYRYTGMERDEETGLAYHGARYYIPELALWASSDPAGITGGANLYVYAFGNPIVLTDPSGLAPGDNDFSDMIDLFQDIFFTDTRAPLTPAPAPMTKDQARAYGNKQAADSRDATGMDQGVTVQAGHTAAARNVSESGISRADWDRQQMQQLHSRKGQGLDVTVVDQAGNTKIRSRHTAQEGLIDAIVDRVRAAIGGRLAPQGQLDAAAEVIWRTENVPMDQRDVLLRRTPAEAARELAAMRQVRQLAQPEDVGATPTERRPGSERGSAKLGLMLNLALAGMVILQNGLNRQSVAEAGTAYVAQEAQFAVPRAVFGKAVGNAFGYFLMFASLQSDSAQFNNDQDQREAEAKSRFYWNDSHPFVKPMPCALVDDPWQSECTR